MNLKKVIKYSTLGLVAVLATSALVACSSGKSASGKKTIEVEMCIRDSSCSMLLPVKMLKIQLQRQCA